MLARGRSTCSTPKPSPPLPPLPMLDRKGKVGAHAPPSLSSPCCVGWAYG